MNIMLQFEMLLTKMEGGLKGWVRDRFVFMDVNNDGKVSPEECDVVGTYGDH